MNRYAFFLSVTIAIGVFAYLVLNTGVDVPGPVTSTVFSTATPTTLLPAGEPGVVQGETASSSVARPVVTEAPRPKPVVSKPDPDNLEAAAARVRRALVNIICSAPSESGIRSISGSGVIISPKGIILANAHVAQYFLLADQGVTCKIRTGSPAVDTYRAELVYISPTWVQENATILTAATPTGTGEHDFALLAITKSAHASVPLPTIFPFVPLATAPPAANSPVALVSYGAQYLDSNQIKFGLYPTVVMSSVKDILTFGANTTDVLVFGGSIAAQEGASGGGVVDTSGRLTGMVTTSVTDGTLDSRSLTAITAAYIRAAYASETGRMLNTLLSGSTDTSVANFHAQAVSLEAILLNALRNNL